MKRFYVIAGGVALMIVTAVVAGIVFGEPGLRLLIFVLPVYLLARRRIAASM